MGLLPGWGGLSPVSGGKAAQGTGTQELFLAPPPPNFLAEIREEDVQTVEDGVFDIHL